MTRDGSVLVSNNNMNRGLQPGANQCRYLVLETYKYILIFEMLKKIIIINSEIEKKKSIDR